MARPARVVCPGCTSEFDAGLMDCPICTRPRTKQEIFESIRGNVLSGAQQSRRKKLKIAAAVVLLAAAYKVLEPRPRPPTGPPPVPVLPPEPEKPPAPRRMTPEELAAEEARVAAIEAARSAKRRAEAEARIARLTPVRKEVPKHWEIRGQVFDLITLKGVPGVTLVFTDRGTAKEYGLKTAPDGNYKARLPILKEGGYDLSLSRGGTELPYLEDLNPSLRKQTLSRRKESLALLNATVLHVPILLERDTFEMTYDIAVRPRAP